MENVDKLQNVSGIQTEHEYWKQYRGLTKRYGLEVSGLYGYLLDKRGLSMKKTREGTHNFSLVIQKLSSKTYPSITSSSIMAAKPKRMPMVAR